MSSWDMLGRCARRKEDLADDWELYMAEILPHTASRHQPCVYHVKLGVPRILTRGPNKGLRRWDRSTTKEQWISSAELDTETALYESETGKCSECMGRGLTIKSASSIDGTTWRECSRCKGTGQRMVAW